MVMVGSYDTRLVIVAFCVISAVAATAAAVNAWKSFNEREPRENPPSGRVPVPAWLPLPGPGRERSAT